MPHLPAPLATLPRTVLGSATAAVQELTAADQALRMPLPLVRRVGVTQLRGGVGASTVAAAVAGTLAGRRGGLVLGVNASAGPAPLAWHAGLPAVAEQSDDPARARPQRSADAIAGLPRTPGGVYAFDLVDRGAREVPAPSTAWFDRVGPIARFFDAVVTDWGRRPWQLDLPHVAAASHAICLVARADRHAAEEAAAIAPALRDSEDHPEVVIALVDVGGTGEGAVVETIEASGCRVVGIPFDAALGGRRPVGSRDLATGTRLALRRLTTALLLGDEGGER